MSAIPRANEASRKNDAGTLGELLYADQGRSRVAESEWALLVHRIAARDALALHALYERSHHLVYTLALRITASRETADELTVDVFHDIWRRAGAYDPQAGTVLAWIMNQARSRAIDRWRFDSRHKRCDPHVLDTAAAVAPAPGDGLELAEQRLRLRAALAVLTPDERHAVETAYFSELTYAETAARLQQPVGTIKTRIRSALAKLREALAADGGTR